MFTTIHRDPVQIVTVNDDNSIVFNSEAFHEAIRRADGRSIVFAVVIGGFQRGKTSFISLLTGNDQHRIGNGLREINSGVTLDGPVFINDIAGQWNINDYIDNNNTALFICDIEGFGGHRRGINTEQNTIFFSKLCVPLFSIASCIIYFADMNNNQEESMLLISLFRMAQVINNQQINLLTLVRNVDSMDDIDYSQPELDSYNRISQILSDDLQSRLIRHQRNITINMKPLPYYNRRMDPFHQNNSYYMGFRFVINDILRILTNNNITNHMNADDILRTFSDAFQNTQAFNFNTVQNNEQDVILNAIFREIENEFDQIESIDSIINRFNRNLDTLNLQNYIPVDEHSIFRNVMAQYMTNFIPVLVNLNQNYFTYDEVNVLIRDINNRAVTQLNGSVESISRHALEKILTKIDNLYHNTINIGALQQRFIERQNQISLSDRRTLIETNQNNIFLQLEREYNFVFNQFRGRNNINQNYFQNDDIRTKFENIHDNDIQRIRREVPVIKQNIIQIIVRKINSLANSRLNIDPIVSNFQLNQSQIKVSNTLEMIEIDENNIKEILHNEFIRKFNHFKLQNINRNYYQINEVELRLNEILRNCLRNINRQVPTIKNQNIQWIINQVTEISTEISGIMERKIPRIIGFMENKQNILKGITDDEFKLHMLFVSLLKENAGVRFYLKVRPKYVEQIQQVDNLKENLFTQIHDNVKKEMPGLIKKMRKRKHLQRFVNFLIGLGVGTVSIALLCSGIGAAIGAATVGTSAAGISATVAELAAAGATVGAITGTIEGSVSGTVLSFVYSALNDQDKKVLRRILEED